MVRRRRGRLSSSETRTIRVSSGLSQSCVKSVHKYCSGGFYCGVPGVGSQQSPREMMQMQTLAGLRGMTACSDQGQDMFE